MKIKITIPHNESWPAQYRGTTQEVEIAQIQFSDGTWWGTHGLPFEVHRPVEQEKQLSGFADFFGAKPKTINVEFRE